MEFIMENWYIMVAAVCVLACIGAAVYRTLRKPRAEQLEMVRKWLLWAVTETETTLGGGTGQLKLSLAYDMFVQRFPWLAKVMPFTVFSGLVDEALDTMRELLEKNQDVKALLGKMEDVC